MAYLFGFVGGCLLWVSQLGCAWVACRDIYIILVGEFEDFLALVQS